MSTVTWALRDGALGDVRPIMAALPAPTQDARSIALGAFAGWLTTLRFLRAGNVNGPPIEFRLPKNRVHIEQPDDVTELRFPSIVFIPQRGQYVRGLGGADVDDSTLDVYGTRTAVACLGEYNETFVVESWSSKKSERRAIAAGLETAMQLGESSQVLRLALPDYFNATATFSLEEQERIDDLDVVKNRRRGLLHVAMTVPVLRLVHSVTLRPVVVDQGDLDVTVTS